MVTLSSQDVVAQNVPNMDTDVGFGCLEVEFVDELLVNEELGSRIVQIPGQCCLTIHDLAVS